ncbi:MAG: replicative DNA helicase [Clostridiales bacterium]|jgi:replicative DNA helicase|nr:replicative DNA helicase [Clostridiales bacterium]
MEANEKNKKAAARAMPYNDEAERCVLGACLIDGGIVSDVVSALSEDDFYMRPHKRIFGAVERLYSGGKAADVVTVTDVLERGGFLDEVGGLNYIVGLSDALPSAANYRYYLDIIKRDSTLRALIFAANEIINDAYENVSAENALSKAEKIVFDISRERDRSSLVNINTVTDGAIRDVENLVRNKDSGKNIRTGFKNFDMWFNGLHRSDLILIAARPGVGKTSLALNIVGNAAIEERKKVAVFSLEMPIEQLAKRLLCGVGHVSMSDISGGSAGLEVFQRLHAANKKIKASDIYVDDSSLNTPADILSKCRRFIKEHGELDLVMIDYLQLMSTGRRIENRQQEISELTRSLKIIAKELNVPILLLSQLSRALETRSDHRPMLSDLRESGAIEQDADIVIFIHKPDLYDTNAELNEVEMIVAKYRNGKTGSMYFEWVGEEVSFRPKLEKRDLGDARKKNAFERGGGKGANGGGLKRISDGEPQYASDAYGAGAAVPSPFNEFNAEFTGSGDGAEPDAFGGDYVPPDGP